MSISPISSERIETFKSNTEVLAKLSKNCEIWTFGNRLVRIEGPTPIDENASPFKQTLNKILSFLEKLFLAIGRVFSGQSEEKTLTALRELTGQLCEELDKEPPETGSNEFYLALEGLGVLGRNLSRAANTGLPKYSKHCENGSHYLIPYTPEVKNKYAEEVQKVIKKIDATILPLLADRIMEMQDLSNRDGTHQTKKIYEALHSKNDLDPAELSKIQLSSEAFILFAETHFSEEHIQRVLKYYGLKQRLVLSGTDVQALFIGLSANITQKDLETVYELQNRGENVKTLNSLGTKGICDLLAEVRNISSPPVENCMHLPYFNQLTHDLKVLDTLNDYVDFDPNKKLDKTETGSLRKYSYTEFLTRHLSYALYDHSDVKFPDGILFSMFDEEGKLCLKEAGKIVGEDGLYASWVRPGFIDSKDKDIPLQVIYRGTNCKDSVLRDISPFETALHPFFDGPGRVSFEKKRDEILAKMQEQAEFLTSQTSAKVTLEVMGHSLGASDAERTVEYLAYKLRKEKNHPFEEVRMFAFNAPSIESDVARRFIKSLDKVKTPFNLHYLDAHHDLVQELGTKRLGYCGASLSKPENLTISLYKFNRPLLEKIEAFAKSLFYEIKFIFFRNRQAHSYFFLKLHNQENPENYNTTFIQNIYTNNDLSVGLHYGKDSKKVYEKIMDQEAMDDHLLTNAARIGRKMKKLRYDILHVLSFGQWIHSYNPSFLELKKNQDSDSVTMDNFLTQAV